MAKQEQQSAESQSPGAEPGVHPPTHAGVAAELEARGLDSAHASEVAVRLIAIASEQTGLPPDGWRWHPETPIGPCIGQAPGNGEGVLRGIGELLAIAGRPPEGVEAIAVEEEADHE